jgi:type II secretory pathway pseudopilin PulG
LLVVIVVIGILVALILPNTLRAIKQANTRECASNIRSIDSAIQMYYTEKKTWPTAITDLQPYFPDEDGNGKGDVPVCSFGVDYALTTDEATAGVKTDRTSHFSADNWPHTHD